VAAALRLRAAGEMAPVDAAWLRYHQPGPEHYNMWGGCLFGLGLAGHLNASHRMPLFRALTAVHELQTLGVLLGPCVLARRRTPHACRCESSPVVGTIILGLAASRVGTRDGLVERLLALHMTALLPTPAGAPPAVGGPGVMLAMAATAAVQAGAMVGMGLLHAGSGDRALTQLLMREMGRVAVPGCDAAGPTPVTSAAAAAAAATGSTGTTMTFGAEAYTLAAGMALGLVLVGRGAPDVAADAALRAYLEGTAPATDGMAAAQTVRAPPLAPGLDPTAAAAAAARVGTGGRAYGGLLLHGYVTGKKKPPRTRSHTA
jgi:anaphase-promoting complex subunit 1